VRQLVDAAHCSSLLLHPVAVAKLLCPSSVAANGGVARLAGTIGKSSQVMLQAGQYPWELAGCSCERGRYSCELAGTSCEVFTNIVHLRCYVDECLGHPDTCIRSVW
jgi:hypothetical protein